MAAPFSVVVVFLLAFSSLSVHGQAAASRGIGVNYGTFGNNLPPPPHAINLLRSVGATAVKIFDADPTILRALSGSPVLVSVMIPNQLIPSVAHNFTFACQWVADNLLPYYASTRIRYLLVGNEVLSDYSIKNSTWPALVPAIANIHKALRAHSIRNVKVGTTLAMDALASSFPPSAGVFRADIADSVMRPLLSFLRKTNSFYFVDAYPYLSWSENYKTISLDYALFQGNERYTDPSNKLTYTNLLDQMLDAVITAMCRLGYRDVKLAIAETGWPNAGDLDQIGANVYNAATYNRNLVKKMTAIPPLGTPARPGVAMPVFIFSLFNENQKAGPGTERHWGLFQPNGSAVYPIDLTGHFSFQSVPLPPPTNNLPYKGPIWCVFSGGKVNMTDLDAAVMYACEQGNNSTCNAIRPTGACYQPNNIEAHANYAFNSYWQQFRKSGGTCFFNGFAAQTAKDPSYGSCIFPSSLN